jgi:protein AIR1/2
MGSAPAPNWNKTGKSVIRTSLRSRQPQSARPSTEPASAVAASNKRSASISSGGETKREEGKGALAAEGESNTQALSPEEGEVDEDKEASASSKRIVSDDSDDSESLDSEADDSIMLNTIGSRGQDRDQNGVISISDDDDDDEDYDPVNAMILGASSRNKGQIQDDAISISDDDSADDYDPETLSINGDDYDPEALPVLHTPAKKDSTRSIQNGSRDGAKGDAFARFAQKYPAPPLILADLDREDLETQARTMFYDRDINDVNLQLPITCIECLREGHLAEVCPTKEVCPTLKIMNSRRTKAN